MSVNTLQSISCMESLLFLDVLEESCTVDDGMTIDDSHIGYTKVYRLGFVSYFVKIQKVYWVVGQVSGVMFIEGKIIHKTRIIWFLFLFQMTSIDCKSVKKEYPIFLVALGADIL